MNELLYQQEKTMNFPIFDFTTKNSIMKVKNPLAIAILLMVCASPHDLFSQITIGQSDMPNVNDTLRVSLTYDTLNPALTGTNYTWNYSYFNPYAQQVREFDDPNSFPSPFNLIFNMFNTSYGLVIPTPDSIGNISIDSAYNFYRESSTQYKQVGVGFWINSAPFPISYNPDDVIYVFPLNYGNIDSSDAEFGFQIPGLGYYGQKIHRVNVADGWGTLITPFGTAQTLRVRSTVTRTDTVYNDSTATGYTFTRPPSYEFKWLSQGGKTPRLQVDAIKPGSNYVVTNIIYRDSVRDLTGLYEPWGGNNMLQVYPNPSNGSLQLVVAGGMKGQIKMYNVLGELVFQLQVTKQKTLIDLSGQEKGLYFLEFDSGNDSCIKKIIIE